MIKTVLGVVDSVSERVGKAFSFLYLFVVAAVCYEIISRFVFSHPTHWVQESTEFACGIAVMLGGAWALRTNNHVRMEELYNELGPRRKALADVLTFPLFLLFAVALLQYTSVFAWKSFLIRETTITSWAPPIWPAKMAMPVGVLLLLLQGAANWLRDILRIAGKE